MSAAGGLSPSDISALTKLAGVAGTLLTVATNPVRWARANLKDAVVNWIAEWVVDGILDAATYVLGWIIFAYLRVRSILIGVIDPLAAPIRIVEDAVVGLAETVYGIALGVAGLAGLAGPPAAAFAVVLLGSILVGLLYATYSVIPGSDALSKLTEGFQ